MIEGTRHGGEYACLVELDEGIRIMGSLESGSAPEAGLRVRLEGACTRDGARSFEFRV